MFTSKAWKVTGWILVAVTILVPQFVDGSLFLLMPLWFVTVVVGLMLERGPGLLRSLGENPSRRGFLLTALCISLVGGLVAACFPSARVVEWIGLGCWSVIGVELYASSTGDRERERADTRTARASDPLMTLLLSGLAVGFVARGLAMGWFNWRSLALLDGSPSAPVGQASEPWIFDRETVYLSPEMLAQAEWLAALPAVAGGLAGIGAVLALVATSSAYRRSLRDGWKLEGEPAGVARGDGVDGAPATGAVSR